MNCYANPYEGDQEYIFFSYCHDDASSVYPIIERLTIEGFRVWYDNGIHPGDDWPEVIASHLTKAKVCVAAISKAAAESHNCRNEVSFAIANNKPLVSIVIEDFPMPLGMQLQLSSSNYIKYDDNGQEAFYRKLISAPSLAECRKQGDSASHLALSEWQKHIQEYRKNQQNDQVPVSRGFIIDPTWFEERKRLEAEIAALNKEREEAEERLKKEKERLLAEAEKQRAEEEQLREQRRMLEEANRKSEAERLAREAEAKRQAEEEARRKAEAEKLAREAEAKRQAEEEARRRAEAEQLAREAEAKRLAEEQKEIKRSGLSGNRQQMNEKVDLSKKDNSDANGDDTASNVIGAMLIRLRTGEIFKLNSGIARIGRAKDADIVFSGNKAISHAHIEIVETGGRYSVKNISSSSVIVNGADVRTGETAELNEYTDVTLGDEPCFFVFGWALKRIIEEKTLRMLRCKETGETRLFIQDSLPLNRYNKWNNNVLGDQRISREHHAELFRDGRASMLRDVGSLHGTFLNGRRLKVGEAAELHNGDVVAVVETEFIYYESTIG